MKRLSKASNSRSSKRCGVAHVSDAKFASLYEKADDDDVDERQPKKTWGMLSRSKLGDGNNLQQKMFVCSKCGKGFLSSKALSGHMACHSQKDKASTLSNQKQPVIMDSQSDTESGAKNLRKRSSKRAKCAKVVDPVTDSRSTLDTYKNCISGASGVEQEQEELAICLMMLSRDSANWGGLNSIGDSSDNNSVILEARSVGTNFVKKDCTWRSEYDADESKFGGKMLKTLCDSNSGYVRIGVENFSSDVNKFLNKNKQGKGSKAETNLSSKKIKSATDGVDLEYGLSGDGERSSQSEKPKMELYSRLSMVIGSYNAANQCSNAEMYRRFEHKALYHKSFITAASTHESGENSLETDGSRDVTKGKGIVERYTSNVGDNRKMRKLECPICFKVFKSVKALGGHRRVHLAEVSADIYKSDEVDALFKQIGSHIHESIDLNLPAPMEDVEATESMDSYRIQELPQA